MPSEAEIATFARVNPYFLGVVQTFHYDVIVVGGGHAGCEAATAAARLGASTCLVTMDLNKVGQMSCNPAVGGIAKGQIVREIDALGGQMGLITDRCTLQFRMLNRSKGPAMWSPRAQCDRARYIRTWRRELESLPGLHLWQDQAEELLVETAPSGACEGGKAVVGVRTIWGVELRARCVVITAGTFLNGLMHMGRHRVAGGRAAEPPVLHLTESLTRCGLRSGRMKTGTPVRIDKRSVDFSLMEEQPGDERPGTFSFLSVPGQRSQIPCWTCYTSKAVHDTLRTGFADSPLFNGQIQSIGPRYCPSIETKLQVFPDRDAHLLFLEPEGEETNEMYLNGFSSSLPADVQMAALRQIPCFRHVELYRPGYAIEYDYFDPTQLKHSLESKVVDGLFLAGQVNGTTGYEEAAGQGLVAGINAARRAGGAEPLVLHRNEAYIGVLIDDLVTKGVDEPYRMFTSRAEYRILLRQDDADLRLTPIGHRLGLASSERYERMADKRERIDRLLAAVRSLHIRAESINPLLTALGTTPLQHGCRLGELLARPQVGLRQLLPHVGALRRECDRLLEGLEPHRREEVVDAVEVQLKYGGYIRREQEMAEKMQKLEHVRIAGKFHYPSLSCISIEARQKLDAIRPDTLAQASRIPGVSPSDINALFVLLNR